MKAINEIEYLKQIDPRWENIKIGNSDTTIGDMGCAITGLSMLSDYFGCQMTPSEIASHANWFQYDSLIWVALSFPNFSFRWREGSLYSKTKLDMEMIKNYLIDDDKAVLLEVDNRRHWVVGLWTNYDGDILAIDTYNGKSCLINEKYNNITGASLFIKCNKDNNKLWKGKAKPAAPDYN